MDNSRLEKIFNFSTSITSGEPIDLSNLTPFLTSHLESYDVTIPPDVILAQQMRHPTGFLNSQGSTSIDACPIIPFQEHKSTSPFATVLYPTPVTGSGKWMFEAIISTPGLAQVGWTVPGCRWTDTDGVGDFHNSFGYDGKRLKLFMNGTSKDYGARWVSGDVIGCCINLDESTVTFYSNGKSLGTIYSRIDKMLRYVPGVSLQSNEKIILNVGDFPFMYPISGYNPTRAMPPTSIQVKVNYLNNCIQGLLQYKSEISQDETASDELAVMISEVFDQLTSIFTANGPYLVVSELCPFIVQLAKHSSGKLVSQYFDFLEGCFEHSYYVWMLEVILKHYGLVWKTCSLGRAVADCFKDAPPPQHYTPEDFSGVTFGHPYSGIEALETVQVIFENVEIPEEIYSSEMFNSLCDDFVFIKFQTAADLQKTYSKVWWSTSNEKVPQESKDAAIEASERVEKTYNVVRKHQYGIMKEIAKRGKILGWLSRLVEYNKDYNKMVVPNGLSSLMMMTNAFHILARFVISDDFKKDYESIPETLFYNMEGFRMSFDRLGGAPEHLLKENQHPIVSIPIPPEWQMIDLLSYLFDLSVSKKIDQMRDLNQKIAQSLATLDALAEKKKELQNNPLKIFEIEAYLSRSRKELSGYIRTRRWLHDLLFCSSEQEVMIELVDVYTHLIQKARTMNPGFIYVPITYMETLLTTYRSLNSFRLHDTGFDLFKFADYPRNNTILSSFYKLLIELLVDDRVVSPDIKDGTRDIVHAILQTGQGLSVVESDVTVSNDVIINLLTLAQRDPEAAVEFGRSVRSIFSGIDFCRPPISEATAVGASPSEVLQKVVVKQMELSGPLFNSYFDKLFDLLNDAFSEFEVVLNSIGERGMPAGSVTSAIEKFKQLMGAIDRICACARALEVLEKASPALFHARNLNTLRLCEVIAYVIGRLFSDTPTARIVVKVREFLDANGVKVVPPFSSVLPILSFIGICIDMWKRLNFEVYDVFSKTPNFDPESFGRAAEEIDPSMFLTDFKADEKSVSDYHYFVEFCEYCVKRKKEDDAEILRKKKKKKCENGDEEKEEEEMKDDDVEMMGSGDGGCDDAVKAALANEELDDESLCEICFANPIDTEFVPCGHRSCRVCIERQMTTDPVCFYCKSHIDDLKKI